MKKRILASALVLLLLLSMTACGAKGGDMMSGDSGPQLSESMNSSDVSYDYGWADNAPEPEDTTCLSL